MAKNIHTFDEPAALTSVALFHDMFNMPVLQSPTIPAENRCELRIALLQEELDELKSAIVQNDIVGIADALSDLQYVLSGAVLEFGLGDKFKQLFDEVQRSNMSKTCKSMEEAKATQAHYLKEKNTDSYIEERDGEYLVFRQSDNKVLKSVEYSAPDLETILFKP
ncbi:MAG: nucleoside triphosphate pyrophosphohydrolase family protein [Saprospiraceae bacterium]|nr:MAG: Phosphoribosyl-ATP pyrophosphohydrolase [Bacteroidetes bacterium OLB9]MCO6463641.1 nucleoside triphosphate pyrophosphohydrolase family protein [Saprospiraceae bacterium]MCZ2338860.1 nucleoside triphosphate pyrophosphohydrolase family protein [Chitinophagales bacterium]